MATKKYKCTFPDCQAEYAKPSVLEVHIRKHTGERPFRCPEECMKTYTNEAHLRRHLQTAHIPHKNATFTCPYKECNRILSNKWALKKHVNQTHNKEYPHMCDVCQKGFQKKHQLQTHKFEHTGEVPFKCEHCEKTFLHISAYKKHKRNHKTHTCVCNKTFVRWSEYLKHRKECVDTSRTCEVCNKKFMRSNNYKNHLKVHEENRQVLKCPMENCDRLYYEKKNLQSHIDIYHLKIKTHPPRRRQLKKEATDVPKQKKPRKDAGSMKKSTALELVGLAAPSYLTKDIIEGKPVEISLLMSDESDIELCVEVRQTQPVQECHNITSNCVQETVSC